MKKCQLKILEKGLMLTLFLFLLNRDSVFSQNPPEISRDIFIAAIVQPWLYFEVLPLDLPLSPDLVSPEGNFNIGESPDVIFKVATNNEGGWEIEMKGENGGLKSLATNYLISTVNGTSTLVAGKEGYGGQATTSFEGVTINQIYDYYGTDIVGEIPSDYRVLAAKHSGNSLVEVAKMKMKASASILTPAASDYTEEIILTIIPLM